MGTATGTKGRHRPPDEDGVFVAGGVGNTLFGNADWPAVIGITDNAPLESNTGPSRNDDTLQFNS